MRGRRETALSQVVTVFGALQPPGGPLQGHLHYVPNELTKQSVAYQFNPGDLRHTWYNGGETGIHMDDFTCDARRQI